MVRRDEGVDVARGLATVAMIVWHTTDGFLPIAERSGPFFFVLSFLGKLPLASFLLLAGVGIALAQERGVAKEKIARRGAELVLLAYALSAFYLLIEWVAAGRVVGSMNELLRSDVLHVIGLSIVVVSLVGRQARIAIAIGAPVVSVLLNPVTVNDGAPLFALFVDVPDVTVLPLLPLVSWTAMGALLAPYRRARWLFLGAPVAAFAYVSMNAVHGELGGVITRGHPAVLFNVLDLGARATVVLAVGIALAPTLSRFAREALLLFGRRSLLAYAFHLPLCFGGAAIFSRTLARNEQAIATIAVILITLAFCATRELAGESLRARS